MNATTIIVGLICSVVSFALGAWLARDERRCDLIEAKDEILILKARLSAHEAFAVKSKFTAEAMREMLAGKAGR